LAALLPMSPPAAQAEPAAIQAKRAQVATLESQLEAIGAREDAAVEAYNGAQWRLGVAQDRIRQNAAELRRAVAQHKRAQVILGQRLAAIYRQPQESLADVILSSGSIADITGKIDDLQRVGRSDAHVVDDLRGLQTRIRTVRVQLVSDRRDARRQVSSAMAQRHRIAGILADRRAVLNRSQGELSVLVAQERRQQAALAAAARERIATERAAQERAAAAAQAAPAPAPAAATPAQPGAAAPAATPAPAEPAAPEPAAAPAPAGGGGRPDVVSYAMQFLGVPYRWGGADPSGFDCSGFAMYVWAHFGVSMAHYTGSQYASFPHVSRDQLEPGDLVFFHGESHEGIYIGGGQFIHAPHTGDVVKISSLSDSWYASGYDGAVRPG
jgi:cell wall-associated NlpC family hydrolase